MNRRSFLSTLWVGAASLPAVAHAIISTRVPGRLNEETYVDWRTELPNRYIFIKENGDKDTFLVEYETRLHGRMIMKSCRRLTPRGPIDVCGLDMYVSVSRFPIMQNGQLDLRAPIPPPIVKVSWRELV